MNIPLYVSSTFFKTNVAGFSISNLGIKVVFFGWGSRSKNNAVSSPSCELSLVLKYQTRRFTLDISPTYDQSIFTVDPGKNINLVPLDGGLTCPKQKINISFFKGTVQPFE
jgi:hypothetical protein